MYNRNKGVDTLNGQALLETLKEHEDKTRAVQMKAYMRYQFDFLGLPAVKRRELMRPYFDEAKKEADIDWDFLDMYWKLPYRECQLIACDYLLLKQDLLHPSDIDKIKALALRKSWWDTVDCLDKVIGRLALECPELDQILLEWSVSDSIWLRRISIDHQRLRKTRMNTHLLEQIILNNLGSSEFFINKAIGWILRDYSKTDPEWVRAFIETHRSEMASLSIREASKYLVRK